MQILLGFSTWLCDGSFSLSSTASYMLLLPKAFLIQLQSISDHGANQSYLYGQSAGGVTSMDDFLEEFFPAVFERKHKAKEDNYCKFDNQNLQLFTSSLYLAALVASFVASKICTKHGRKLTMQAASIFFLVGVILNAAAVNIAMLIIGRILLGVGVGFANQVCSTFFFIQFFILEFLFSSVSVSISLLTSNFSWKMYLLLNSLSVSYVCHYYSSCRQFLYSCRRSHQFTSVEP